MRRHTYAAHQNPPRLGHLRARLQPLRVRPAVAACCGSLAASRAGRITIVSVEWARSAHFGDTFAGVTIAPEDVRFLSGGTSCAGWLYRPRQQGAPAPVVVLAPGLAGVRRARVDAFGQRFAEDGLAALVFDYRCLGDSAGEPRQLVRLRHQVADWHSAVTAARRMPGLDPSRVGLWGGSITGGHVLRVAAQDPLVAAVVSQVPFVDGLSSAAAVRPLPSQPLRLLGVGLTDFAGALLGRAPRYVPVVGPPSSLAVLTSPDADPEYRAAAPPDWDDRVAARVALGLLAYRPARQVRTIRCPVLLAVGEHDVITPPRRAARLVGRALDVEVRWYPVRHFESFLGTMSDQMIADASQFLRRHLGVDAN
jgi:fermentation-respiration switch protein FrsA (DUF1100 family)